MTQQYYLKKWEQVQDDLNYVINQERPLKPEPMPKTLGEAFDRVCSRYVQYISIYKRLIKCYDYMVHPQKRDLIGRCIEAVVGRIVELRHEVVRISINEYAAFGPFCVANKILPSDLEMSLSKTFAAEKVQRLQQRLAILEFVYTSMGRPEETDSQESLLKPTKPKNDSPSTPLPYISRLNSSPPSIQNLLILQRQKMVNWKKVLSQFKIFQNKLIMDTYREVNDKFLGMAEEAPNKELEKKENRVVADRIAIARDHEDDYLQRHTVLTETVKDSAAARNTEEDMIRNIHQWILECRDAIGAFPEFPTEDIGGSQAIFAKKTPEKLQQELEGAEEEKGKGKSKEKPKESKPDKKLELSQGYMMLNSRFLEENLIEVAKEYDSHWRDRDDSQNFKQTFSQNLLEEKVKENLEDVIRKEIDQQMRVELENMNLAVDKLKAAKAKVKKIKEKKVKDKKKDKQKIKDLTPNADVEDLYTELLRNDVLKRVRKVNLDDFLGNFNLMSEKENSGRECRPDLGDVRKMLFDFVVLPMSSEEVHMKAPFTKSLLIAGPQGCGKSTLVHAVCNELGANLFDLTASNIAGKYMDAEGQQMLMHLVMKVGKLLEPSIIMIDDCDLMFTKTLPPGIKYNPARMRSNLMKALKSIGPEDRIMLIGLSARAYEAAKGPLFKMYEKVIPIYPPAYSSRYTIWQTTIKAMGGIITKNLLVTTLAQVSNNFLARDIMQSISEVVTVKRLQRQNTKSLQTIEFGDRISQFTPLYKEELETLQDWLGETPLAKKRENIKALEAEGINIFDMLPT